ncbi:hypothetical protein AVEN_262967-1 [Araneus ventricosus]|uniref:Uncharacterized protein n=1 Tax=Araneus ventricosus TaxID=182803 RepID=A0A4Y2DGC3_ARAVE|nr:hypothetical protein AVEN_262967-1 [Araneus ventricosus]
MVFNAGVNMVDLGFVEDSVNGGLGLSSGFVVGLKGDVFGLRKLTSDSSDQEKLLVSEGQDIERTCVMRVPGSCGKSCSYANVDEVFSSLVNSGVDAERTKELLLWQAHLLVNTGKKPMSQREMDPRISRMHSGVLEKWKERNCSTCIRERAGGETKMPFGIPCFTVMQKPQLFYV